MSRALSAGGEVGGSTREWGGSSGGGVLTPARGPTYQIVIITLSFELFLTGFSCLSLIHLSSSSPQFPSMLWFFMVLYITVNFQ